MPKSAKQAADYILPLNVNGLKGRMLRAPASRKKYQRREILLIYGHHAMLERWWSLVQNLENYGNVTMPDLPGFGGMDSFAKIGIKPDIDAYADYLAAFIKMRYKQKKVTIYAISFGFVVVTRMLQRNPDLAKKVELLISVVGFMHHKDFLWPARQKFINRMISRLFATRPFAFAIRYVFLNKFVIRTLTNTLPHSKHRFVEVTPEEFVSNMNFEVKLWQSNDVRTHWLTTSSFFTLDNTGRFINVPVIHIISKGDQYFNNVSVEQHMRRVFSGYTGFKMESKAHTPHVTADKKATAVMIPVGLRRRLLIRKK